MNNIPLTVSIIIASISLVITAFFVPWYNHKLKKRQIDKEFKEQHKLQKEINADNIYLKYHELKIEYLQTLININDGRIRDNNIALYKDISELNKREELYLKSHKAGEIDKEEIDALRKHYWKTGEGMKENNYKQNNIINRQIDIWWKELEKQLNILKKSIKEREERESK